MSQRLCLQAFTSVSRSHAFSFAMNLSHCHSHFQDHGTVRSPLGQCHSHIICAFRSPTIHFNPVMPLPTAKTHDPSAPGRQPQGKRHSLQFMSTTRTTRTVRTTVLLRGAPAPPLAALAASAAPRSGRTCHPSRRVEQQRVKEAVNRGPCKVATVPQTDSPTRCSKSGKHAVFHGVSGTEAPMRKRKETSSF